MCIWIKKLLGTIKAKKMYSLIDTFGCTEVPPQDCPTFLERSVHRQFKNALKSYNIIVVYGESRQGKTWTIERYCPNQLRIGCNAEMDIRALKEEMLHLVNTEVLQVEHTITDEYSEGESSSAVIEGGMHADTQLGISGQLKSSAGLDTSASHAHKETVKTSYPTVDMTSSAEFVDVIKAKSNGKFFVFDNFHYLHPSVQQQFCSLLKEFNYKGIKIIIVGVWKDASRITSLASDLLNRCQHIDIGSWNDEELEMVVEKGEQALNIEIAGKAKELYKTCCAKNIGIFKDFLQKYCQRFDIEQTQSAKKVLDSVETARDVANEVVLEAFKPLRDRAVNLALPQRVKKDSKHMRQKIVIAIMELIVNNDIEIIQQGIGINSIAAQIDKLCEELGDEKINISNLTQELGLIHLREENRQTGSNFIPLFFYDRSNKKLLVIEPTIYEIKAYNIRLLEDIIVELKENMIAPISIETCLSQT